MIHEFNGKEPILGADVFCVDSAQIIGDVVIGDDSSIWFNVVIRGDVNFIRIGNRTNIQDGTVIHVTHELLSTHVGDDVTVGHNVTLHGCRIGDRCLIGMGAIVMDGADIANDCMIAAGALVTPGTKVQSGTLVGGAPAKYMRHLDPEEIAGLKKSAENYTKYVKAYKR